MAPPLLLVVPVLIWVAAGVGLAAAYRAASTTLVLRLAAGFLALWSLLATTALLWVIENGGWSAILRVARSPSELLPIFGPAGATLWIAGAVGAFAILLVAFVMNQVVGRGILVLLDPAELPWPEGLAPPPQPVRLLGSRAPERYAFSFALLTVGTRPGRLSRTEVIVLSQGLRASLTEEEVRAVVAHEVGHIAGLDGRYLTFLRTLARLMRWDPLFAYISSSVTRREEYRADDAAVLATGRPLDLARALYKVGVVGPAPPPRSGPAGLLGEGGERGRREAIARIRRLVAMAESSERRDGSSA